MQLINALAQTFRATPFDIFYFLMAFAGVFVLYYFVPLRRLYEVGFGAIVGMGIYILLSVLLLENSSLGTLGGLLPFGLSVFILSIAVYLVIILAVIFPLNGGLVISETTNPILYTIQFLFVGFFIIIGLSAVLVYMIEQAYVFRVGTIFVWIRDWPYYFETIRLSNIFKFIMTNQNVIIPLAVLLMIYKIFFSNIVSAVVLSLIYNLSRVGFYRKKDDSSYRVEFHEIGWSPEKSEEE